MSLRRGQRFTLGGIPYKVAFVSFSRAHCVGETKHVVTLTDRKGQSKTFTRRSTHELDISPDSDIDALNAMLKGLN